MKKIVVLRNLLTTSKEFIVRCSRIFLSVLFVSSLIYSTEYSGVCYSPFRNGQSPTGVSPTRAQITEDLVLIKTLTSSIRTFGIDKDYLKLIPEVAESLGISYNLSVWTSTSYRNTWADGRNDLAKMVKKADSLKWKGLKGITYGYYNVSASYPESTQVASLCDSLKKAKKVLDSTGILFSHEENWDVFVRHPELVVILDYISIRIIPQDDLYKNPAQAAAYAITCYDSVKKAYPDKKVVTTSIGWSTYESSESQQKVFIDSIAKLPDYFLTIFRDENWKYGVEKSFGLFTISSTPKRVVYVNGSDINPLTMFKEFKPNMLEGLVYAKKVYPTGVSLSALQKDLNRWADSSKGLTQMVFFDVNDGGIADSSLIDIFSQKGNRIGVISNNIYNPNLFLSRFKTDVAVTSIHSSYFSGAKDSNEYQARLDILRETIITTRTSSINDSVILLLSDFSADSLLKYPEVMNNFDGYTYFFDMYSYTSKAVKEADFLAQIDSIQKKLGKKQLLIKTDIGNLSDRKHLPAYQALMKAKEKYGFPIVCSSILNMYSGPDDTASAIMRIILPGRFPAVSVNTIKSQTLSLPVFSIGKNMINIRTANEEGVASFYNLQGRVLWTKELEKLSNAIVPFNTLSNGLGVIKFKTKTNSISARVNIVK